MSRKKKLQFIAGAQKCETVKQVELVEKGLLHTNVHHPKCKLIKHLNN